MKSKGIIFTIDGLLALIFIALFVAILTIPNSGNTKNLEEFEISQKINDLLISSQVLEIDSFYELETNYTMLFGKRSGYLKINNYSKELSYSNNKNNFVSNSITYINSSGLLIYIEVGVYF